MGKPFLNIATSSQWITFPVSAKDQTKIYWQDGRNKYENTYYVAKCYYGILEELVPAPELVLHEKLQVPSPIVYLGKKKMTILGETKIFIAAEFFEDEYAGSPSDFAHFHLKDIAHSAIASEKSPWVTMKLNGVFCYGQSYGLVSVKRRYIIYHPCVGPGIRRPKIYQHRFTGDTEVSEGVMKGLEGSAKKVPDPYKPLGAVLSEFGKLVFNVGKASVGDELWVFLDENYLEKVEKKCPELKYLGDEGKLKERLAEIQAVEKSGTAKIARDFMPDRILPPPGNKPALPSQPEGVPDPVNEVNDQGLADEVVLQRLETLIVRLEGRSDEIYGLQGYQEEEQRRIEEEKEAERKELEGREENAQHNSQYDRAIGRQEQDKAEERRREVVGSQPTGQKSLIEGNLLDQAPQDPSPHAIFPLTRAQSQAQLESKEQAQSEKRPPTKAIITTHVPGQKPVEKRIFERPESHNDVDGSQSQVHSGENYVEPEGNKNARGNIRARYRNLKYPSPEKDDSEER
ncbi:hypothetical protein N7456_013635 [Penicillium angulare]|uniref:Uncharacterized protein n=1 Tax=Penicillium angulare TaxID=116970 RepID=A0A9W9JT39_9EURO|nr:hypothetical protein N7456_013635 [Penicillium angulare]